MAHFGLKYYCSLRSQYKGVYWRGFLVADLYSESFAAPPYEVTIKAVDGFKLLSNIAFLAPDQTRWSGTMSLWQIISECLSLLELDISISDWMDLYAEGTNENESPLRQVYIDMERFYYVYEEPSYRDALELCLRPFAGQIFQSGGSLHIRRAISLYNANRPLSFMMWGQSYLGFYAKSYFVFLWFIYSVLYGQLKLDFPPKKGNEV